MKTSLSGKLLGVVFMMSMASVGYCQDHKIVFSSLHALEGTWIMKTTNGSMGERWKKITNDFLQNEGFYINGKDTIITERVALKILDKGIYYTSTVEDQNNKTPVSFRLTSEKNKAYTFENSLHDFPKRIVYKLVSSDSIYAFIDDGKGGKRQDFYYRKVN